MGAFAAVAAAVTGFPGTPEEARGYWLAVAALSAGAAVWLQMAELSVRGRIAEERRNDREGGVSHDPIPLDDVQLTFQAMFSLPPDVDDYVNQRQVLGRVRAFVERASASEATEIMVSAITGRGGIGKTALAVRVAHEIRDLFPDGELYINMHGYDRERRTAYEVLDDFLRALGVDGGAIPRSLDQRALMYQARMSRRRMLVIIDNAGDESQVRPLLPANPRCAVIVTSRSRLAGLERLQVVSVELLEPDVAVDLLHRAVGHDRVAAEPEAAADIVRLCGYLPLAIRIAGAKLVARPHWRLSLLAERLANERRRLQELQVGDRAVRSSFALSFAELPDAARRLFRLLGLIETPDFPAWVADVLLADARYDGHDLIESLVDVALLEPAGADSSGQYRYRFHDLIRLFARELLYQEESSETIAAAFRRLVHTYLSLVERADAALHPGGRRDVRPGAGDRPPPDERAATAVDRDALVWLEMERFAVVKLVEDAHRRGMHEAAWQLAAALTRYFDLRARWQDWAATHEFGLRSAEELGDSYARGVMLWGLGVVRWYDAHWSDAIDALRAAEELFRGPGNERERALALRNLGVVYRDQSRWAEAQRCYEQAVSLFEVSGDRQRVALTLRNLGDVHRDAGRYRDAQELFDRSAAIYADVVDESGVAYLYRSRGDANWGEGRLDEALEALTAARSGFSRLRDRRAEARTLRNIGLVYQDQGRWSDAEVYFERSIDIFTELGDRHGMGRTEQCLGDVYRQLGRAREAFDRYQASLEVFRELGDQLWQGKTLAAQGLAVADLGDREAARRCWREALEIFERLGIPEADRVRGLLAGQ